MYHEMNLNIDNFELIIEETANPEQYDWILQRETELIIQYDSVLFGYNVSPDGKPGWKENTFCVNDGTYDLYIYKKDIERFCQNGWKLGSCKHDFLKGTVWVNNGIIGKMINPDDLDKYLTKGFTLGNITSPNKGKTWVNDGVKSRLLNVEDLNNPEYKNYTNFGRIEYRQSSITKNTKTVNNGIKEIRISIDKIEDFLKDNLDYRLGKIKKKKK